MNLPSNGEQPSIVRYRTDGVEHVTSFQTDVNSEVSRLLAAVEEVIESALSEECDLADAIDHGLELLITARGWLIVSKAVG